MARTIGQAWKPARPGFLKILQLIYMNLSNYFIRIYW